MNLSRIAAALTAVALGLAGQPARAAETGEPIACVRQGSVTTTPGLTFTAQDFTFDERGTLTCRGTAGTALTAKVSVRRADMRAHGSCAFATFDGLFTAEWSDGTTSRGRGVGTVIPPVATAKGEFTDGRFAGRTFTTRVLLMPRDPELCASAGVTEIGYVGELAG